MKLKVLKTEGEYEAALAEIEKLIDSAKPNRDRLELLVLLVHTYEDSRYPIDLSDPVEVIKFRMEQAGLKQKDLIPFID
jgi:HTH-type transcriptional regulator / antitoxin HigA